MKWKKSGKMLKNQPLSPSSTNTKAIGQQAAYLSLVEISLGSLLHGMKIPLSGQYLSLLQIAFMSRATYKLESSKASLQISLIAALLKSLSPAGKKLTPMLAIFAQGLLFSLGVTLFRINFAGLAIAAILSSLWAFVQPVLIIYLLFGNNLLAVADHFFIQLQKILTFDLKFLWPILIGMVVIKALLALIVCFVAIRMSEKDYLVLQEKLIKKIALRKNSNHHGPLVMALKDLFSPLFLFSFLLTGLFFYYSNDKNSQIIWALLRPLAVGFILFYIIRVYPIERLSLLLEKCGLHTLAESYKEAIKIIKTHHEK